MSSGRAIRQREEMIKTYQAMLEVENNSERKADIEAQILLVKDEISQIKQGKPLFGRPRPLAQKTTIIEPDKEKGKIVTVLNSPKDSNDGANLPNLHPADGKKIGNRLREALRKSVSQSTEDSLKAKVAAAKANRK